jgi:hypothetical protein
MLHAPAASSIDGTEWLGYLASGLVLMTFSVRSTVALRALALLSNLAFIGYAWCAGLAPVMTLHVVLLPLNAWRLWQEVD